MLHEELLLNNRLLTQGLALARNPSARGKSKTAQRHTNAQLLKQVLALARNTSARGKNKKAQRHQAPARKRRRKRRARGARIGLRPTVQQSTRPNTRPDEGGPGTHISAESGRNPPPMAAVPEGVEGATSAVATRLQPRLFNRMNLPWRGCYKW